MRRKQNDIDKAFTDRAWSEMKAMLDREMPVENNRRKPVFWWWLSVALITGLVIGGLGMWGLNSEKPVQSATPESQIEQKQAPQTKPVAAIETDKSPTSKKGALAENSSNAPTSISNSKKARTTKHPVNVSQPIIGQLTAEQESQNVVDDFTDASVVEETQNNSPAVPPLAMLSGQIQTLNYAGRQELNLPTQNSRFSQKQKSIYLAAQHNYPDDGIGFAVGYLRHFPMGHSGWTFNLGVGYSYLQRPLFIRQSDTLGTANMLEVFNTEYGFELTYNDAFAANEAITTNRRQDLAMHYLELPISVSKTLHPRFGVAAGVTPSLLLATAPDIANGGLLQPGNAKTALEDTSPAPAASDAATLVPVKGFDLKLTGGVFYRVSPNWKLTLDYQHGLVDVLESNSTKEYHRLLKLGVQYTYSGK